MSEAARTRPDLVVSIGTLGRVDVLGRCLETVYQEGGWTPVQRDSR